MIIDDQEDMVDGLYDEDLPMFFDGGKKSGKFEKSKTANVTNLIKEANKNQNKKGFENTTNFSMIKKNSFFSQSKSQRSLIKFFIDNAEEVYYDDCDEEDTDGELVAYDERTQ